MKDELKIDGRKYVLAESIKERPVVNIANKKYVMCRTYSAGVFAGYLKKRVGKEAITTL